MEYNLYRISTATLLGIAGVLLMGVLLAVLLHRRTATRISGGAITEALGSD